jgi:PIN domain nuclease of toxin-antitoxin system
VKLLLDTHAALWLLAGDERFGAAARARVTGSDDQVLLSAVVVLEVAIKRSLGKLDAPDDFAAALLGAGALPLAVSLEHAAAVADLPWHHRDPFARLLLAQARIEGAVVVSGDEALRPYGVPTIW